MKISSSCVQIYYLGRNSSDFYPQAKPKKTRTQSGSALITALFIMTLIAIAATAMTMRLQLDIYRTRLTLTTDKLHYASQLVTFWAISELSQNKNPFAMSDLNGKVAQFPAKLSAVYPQFKLTGALYDLQSRFNLNNLTDPKYFLTMLRLLDDPNIHLKKEEKKQLVMTINQWISPYKPGHNKEDSLANYLGQNPPYLPAHQLLHSVSELRLLKGITASVYNTLLPQVSALPESTPLNINTMSPQLLHILGYGLTAEQIDTIIQKRAKKGITNQAKLTNLLKILNIRPEQVTIISQYFLCITTVTSADLTTVNFTILKRNQDKKGNSTVSLLSESLNTL